MKYTIIKEMEYDEEVVVYADSEEEALKKAYNTVGKQISEPQVNDSYIYYDYNQQVNTKE